MGEAGVITRDHAQTIKAVGPKAAVSLLERQPNALERFLKDVNFPPRTSDGEFVGKESFQIVFDRKLGADDQSGGNDIATWLYSEWSGTNLDGGDRFILASGTITASQDVEVTVGGLAVVRNGKTIEFYKAGRVKFDGEAFSRDGPLNEEELCSSLASFRSSVSKGATLYSGEMEVQA